MKGVRVISNENASERENDTDPRIEATYRVKLNDSIRRRLVGQKHRRDVIVLRLFDL
jgi:hypothetical protein